ncbi:N-acetylmuramic acid 6-phosphate etherase [Caproicibacter fermentans]|uniref:N-acetylmuramic acid 6-phosphate etherase n=1 Tax=Caproicibacter fermentans TaxID=2576756 RepID=A0A7G8TB28_9FIRM|nr:N-acetylmuramic acid 6-phosphate etherase [Caproicibacter fermentans]QNK40819.1 N-acetylmuramic acid 6-phosphate etherase [Caproicibacter fermentans]
MDQYLSGLTTEGSNPRTLHIDECETEEILTLMNEEDQTVPQAVRKELVPIARAVDLCFQALKRGGKLYYVGAGTSGRLGVLDASECPPTYGTDPSLIQGFIAGGDRALREAVEGCEDDAEAGERLIMDHGITENDIVVGITASGGTPFVLGAVKRAGELGATTVGLVNNANTKLGAICDVCIAPIVGPEVITGSTRMKSGTAQKLVLNMLTTAVMIKMGKVYNNLMVDLKAGNQKLYDRSVRIIRTATHADAETAAKYLKLADMHGKTAILMIETGLDATHARQALAACGGRLKAAILNARNRKEGQPL